MLDSALRNVLRKIDEADAGLFGFRLLERLADYFRNDLRLADLNTVLGDRVEQVHQVQVLMALLVHPRRRGLASYSNHRCVIHIGIRHTGDEVGSAGAERREADSRLAGEAAVDVCHEGGALLVARCDEAHLAVQQRIHHIDVFLSRDAEDVFHALVFETANEQLSSFHWLVP